jgi:hypothetical protein
MKKKHLVSSLSFLVVISTGCLLIPIANLLSPEEETRPQIPSDFELLEEGLSLPIRIDSGTEVLDNYREEGQIRAFGTAEDGTVFEGYQDYLREIDRVGDAKRESETRQLPDSSFSGSTEWAEYEGFWYYIRDSHQGGRVCEIDEIPEDTSHFSDEFITRILVTITPGEKVDEGVLVNGVLADVYQISDVYMLFSKETQQVTGQAWIAQDPAYFIKAEGVVEGVMEFDYISYQTNAEFSYELKDFGQVRVELPALCANPPDELIPRPQSATDLVHFPEMVTFSSSESASEIKSFYLEQLPVQGWQVEEVPSEFDEILEISITTKDGIQIEAKVKIAAMANDTSYVSISWIAQE